MATLFSWKNLRGSLAVMAGTGPGFMHLQYIGIWFARGKAKKDAPLWMHPFWSIPD
jgi:hypothetical protein